MRLPAPRIEPLTNAELTPAAREALSALPEFAQTFNIFRTQAHNPDALKAFLAWGNYVLSQRNSLTARQRELAILRTGWLCRAGYEWAQHVVIGERAGISTAELAAIKLGPDAVGWNPLEAAILRACDELVRDHFMGNATWAALSPLGDTGRVDLVYTVGQYTQVSMLLNSCGVQLDPGLVADSDLG
jgi:4-carboxymuconolactone decarboxylase